jgi:hypothetical protein
VDVRPFLATSRDELPLDSIAAKILRYEKAVNCRECRTGIDEGDSQWKWHVGIGRVELAEPVVTAPPASRKRIVNLPKQDHRSVSYQWHVGSNEMGRLRTGVDFYRTPGMRAGT